MLTAAFFIGIFVAFSKLAERYQRTKWKTIITGFLVFFGTQFLCGFFIGIYKLVNNEYSDFKNYNSFSVENLVIIALSLILTYLYYQYLQKKFVKEKINSPENEIQKIGEKQEEHE